MMPAKGVFKIEFMNRKIRIYICCLLLLLFNTHASAEKKESSDDLKWKKVVAEVKNQKTTSVKDALETIKQIRDEETRYSKELRDLKKEKTNKESELEKLKKEFSVLLELEKKLKTGLEEENREIKTIEATFRSAVKETSEMFSGSIINPELKNRNLFLSENLKIKRFPGMEEIGTLFDILSDDIKVSGTIEKTKGSFLGTSGKLETGNILRAGAFTAYFEKDGRVGFLTAGKNSFKEVPGDLKRGLKNSIGSYFDGSGSSLPLDFSKGSVFKLIEDEKDLWKTFKSGGVMVWPILLIGVVAMILAVERFAILRKYQIPCDKEFEKLKILVHAGSLKKATDLCNSEKNYLSYKVVGKILNLNSRSKDVLENGLLESVLEEIPKVERFLPTLNVLASVAPLFGLLGTVTGMINTFYIISTFGTGDPKMMSGGISEALITTQVGLAVAIPIMLIHHYYERRTDKITADMEEKGTAVSTILLKSGEEEFLNAA